MTEESSQKGGQEKAPEPDFASCCQGMSDGIPAMERMMAACGPMMRRMLAACSGGSDRTEPAAEEPGPADA